MKVADALLDVDECYITRNGDELTLGCNSKGGFGLWVNRNEIPLEKYELNGLISAITRLIAKSNG